jgi:hypothetical protein
VPYALSPRAVTSFIFLASAIALAAIAYWPLRGDTFITIDAAIKFLQASALVDSGFESTALPYPASAIDVDSLFVPFDPPYVFRNAGGYESIFPTAYAMLTAPIVHLGPGALRVLSIFGGAAAAVATGWLSERGPRWVPAILILFATPVWYYATSSGEVTLALAASTLAFVLATSEASVDLFCGLLIGSAAIVRDESLLLVPGLLYARYRYARGSMRVLPLLAGVVAPVVLFALLDDLWLKRPMLAHLRHAVPMLNLVLPRSHAILPALPRLSWPDRYATIVHYWMLGGGTLLIAGAIVVLLLLAFLLRRKSLGAIVVALVLIAAAVLQWHDIIPLLSAPRFIAGLLHLSPFLLFALLPAAPGSSEGPARAVALVTSGAFLALTWITLSTAAGKGLGPRLTMALWPLLVAASWDCFRSWWRWPGPQIIRGAIIGSGAALIAGSLVMELAVALPAWTGRVRADEDALNAVRAAHGKVVVLNDDVDMQLVGAEYFRRRVMFVARPELWVPLAARLAASGEREFLAVSRTPDAPREIPPFHLADEQLVSRYHLQHFVR